MLLGYSCGSSVLLFSAVTTVHSLICGLHSLHVLKHSSSLIIQIVPTERNNQRIQTNWTVDPGAEADSIPLVNTTTSNTQNTSTSGHVDNSTTFANTDFNTVIENPSPEHPADGEVATQTTAHGVCDNACL